MARFGDYESIREVYRGGFAVVYTTRPPGGAEESRALKVLQLPDYLADDERIEQESVLFIESCETQRRAAAGGAWAPIHASGRCEGGAWYATDFFERSAEKLVVHRRDLEAAELFRIVEAVVQGLISLREIERRPHGNLKPTNVLISGRGDVSGARIVLSDPVPSSRVKNDEDAVKDLRDLGDLVHQLVLHRPMRNVMAWPLQLTPEWQRLGRVGAGWLELCNALLNPTSAPPSLDEVAGFLPDLSAKPTGGSSAAVAGATPQPGSGPAPAARAPSKPPASAPTPTPASRPPDLSRSSPAPVAPTQPSVPAPSAPAVPSLSGAGSRVDSGSAAASSAGTPAPASGATPLGSGSHPGSGAPARAGLGKWKDQEASALPEKGLPARSRVPLYAGIALGVVAVVAAAIWLMSGIGPDPRTKDVMSGFDGAVQNARQVSDLIRATSPDQDLKEFESEIGAFESARATLGSLEWVRANADKVKTDLGHVQDKAGALARRATALQAAVKDPRDPVFVKTLDDARGDAVATRDRAGQSTGETELAALTSAIEKFDTQRAAFMAVKLDARTAADIIRGKEEFRTKHVAELNAAVAKAKASSLDPREKARDLAKVEIGAAQAVLGVLETDAQRSPLNDQIKTVQDFLNQDGADPDKLKWKKDGNNSVAQQYADQITGAVGELKSASDSAFKNVPDPRVGSVRETLEKSLADADATAAELRNQKKADPGLEKDIDALRATLVALDPQKVPWAVENVATIRTSLTTAKETAEATEKKAAAAWEKNAPDPRPAAVASAQKALLDLGGAEQQARAVLGAIPKAVGLPEADRGRLTASLNGALAGLASAREQVSKSMESAASPAWGVRTAPEARSQVEALAKAEADARGAAARVAQLVSENATLMAQAKELHRKHLADLGGKVVAAINAGMLPTDTLEGVPLEAVYKDLADQIKADADLASLRSDPAIIEAGQRLSGMTEIARATDPAVLSRALRDAAGRGRVSEGWLALSRLASPEQKGVPASSQDLGVLAGAIAQLQQSAGQIADGARAKDLSVRIGAAGKSLWKSYVGRLDFNNAADLKAVQDTAPALQITAADRAALGGRERFNFLLADYRAALVNADDARTKELSDRFRADVESLDSPTRSAAGVDQGLASIDQAFKVVVPVEQPPDFTKVGPGKHQWVAEEGKGGDTVTYRKGGQTLVFARVSKGADTMLLTTELSLGQFIAIVDDGGNWQEIARATLLPSSGSRNTGPRTWVWKVGNEKIETAGAGAGGFSKGWLAEYKDTVQVIYPPDVAANVAPPDLDSPMQYVSPAGAVYAARLIGCRLPTSAEWAAALATESQAGGAPPPANRRDLTWEEVRRFVEEQSQRPENKTLNPNWPDSDIMLPPRFQAVGKSAKPAVPENDGQLWFSPVAKGGGSTFHHLVGNVAEFVYEKPAELEDLGPEVNSILVKLGSNSDKSVLVLGASALSPPEVEPATGVQSRFNKDNPAAAAKCDVGFRLAFSSKSGPPKPRPLPDRVRDAAANIAFIPAK